MLYRLGGDEGQVSLESFHQLMTALRDLLNHPEVETDLLFSAFDTDGTKLSIEMNSSNWLLSVLDEVLRSKSSIESGNVWIVRSVAPLLGNNTWNGF